MESPPLTPPAIGQPWPGQGGIYAGLVRGEDGKPDAHLIVATETIGPATWKDALDKCASYSADEHTDFQAPSRMQSALCYANLKPEFCAVHDGWYWTGTQDGAHYAWAQYFSNGYQGWYSKDCQLRVRPVRSIQAQ